MSCLGRMYGQLHMRVPLCPHPARSLRVQLLGGTAVPSALTASHQLRGWSLHPLQQQQCSGGCPAVLCCAQRGVLAVLPWLGQHSVGACQGEQGRCLLGGC